MAKQVVDMKKWAKHTVAMHRIQPYGGSVPAFPEHVLVAEKPLDPEEEVAREEEGWAQGR